MNDPATDASDARRQLADARESLLEQFHERLEVPMLVLSLVWLALFVVEVIRGLTPLLEDAGYVRAARVARGLRMLRLVSSLNRGMAALGTSLGRRGFAYVMMLSFIVLLAGAAGIDAFERGAVTQGGIDSYGTALWWTAMILTTMGSDYWPKTAEGRILCVILALYAFAVFGYVTATLATYFVGRDAADSDAPIAGQDAFDALRNEIARLREAVQALHPLAARRPDEGRTE